MSTVRVTTTLPGGGIGETGAPAGPKTDGDLHRELVLGVHRALVEVHDRHHVAMRKIARRIVGPDSADDVVQDVLLRLWRSPDRFDAGRGSLRSYLSMQTAGRALDVLRSESSRRARETASPSSREALGDGADEWIPSWVDGQRVQRLLDGLGAGEREAIVLAFFGAHTYAEVARMLVQPEGTVKGRIRSGLGRMRCALEEEGVLRDPRLEARPSASGRSRPPPDRA